jgi:hypothetical protein
MHGASATGGGVPSPALPFRLLIVLMAVLIFGVTAASIGSAQT